MHIHRLYIITQSALLLSSFTDAALARVHALTAAEQEVGKDPSPTSSSHRAAIAYLLHEWLRSLEPTLFPPPLPAAAASKVDSFVLLLWTFELGI